ncbi:MAG: elongation factor P [Novosphingobium sp.]
MKRIGISLGTLLSIVAAGPALAAPGGPIDTIHRGEYYCELPGDATGPAGYPVAEEGFEILSGSSYATASGGGAYLLTGDLLVMTSGPKRGQRFNRLSSNFLRKLAPDGTESPLRCVRRTRNNS